ncbi:hypothetical protein F5883DRAFT_236290 [Diaporthe sp. PMI_573]|nr:hypothetical protein F5883DRAFT_236290 [Diaporthaceae sp. PMI_573]
MQVCSRSVCPLCCRWRWWWWWVVSLLARSKIDACFCATRIWRKTDRPQECPEQRARERERARGVISFHRPWDFIEGGRWPRRWWGLGHAGGNFGLMCFLSGTPRSAPCLTVCACISPGYFACRLACCVVLCCAVVLLCCFWSVMKRLSGCGWAVLVMVVFWLGCLGRPMSFSHTRPFQPESSSFSSVCR